MNQYQKKIFVLTFKDVDERLENIEVEGYK